MVSMDSFVFKGFEKRKKKAMEKLRQALTLNKVDAEVMPIINLLNSFPQWFTTSSCAGRLALLSKGGIRSKYDAAFWFKTHDPGVFHQVKRRLPRDFKGQLWLLVSPPMFHVAARTLKDALLLQQLARHARLGYTKIQSISPSIIVEVLGTGNMAIPIGQDGQIFISSLHLERVLELAAKMLAEDQARMWKWYDLLKELIQKRNWIG